MEPELEIKSKPEPDLKIEPGLEIELKPVLELEIEPAPEPGCQKHRRQVQEMAGNPTTEQ